MASYNTRAHVRLALQDLIAKQVGTLDFIESKRVQLRL